MTCLHISAQTSDSVIYNMLKKKNPKKQKQHFSSRDISLVELLDV